MQIVPTVGKTFSKGGREGNAKGQGAKPQRGKPQPKNLNMSKRRKQREKNFAKNAQLFDIANTVGKTFSEGGGAYSGRFWT
jgi:hypothetical protein